MVNILVLVNARVCLFVFFFLEGGDYIRIVDFGHYLSLMLLSNCPSRYVLETTYLAVTNTKSVIISMGQKQNQNS